MTMQQTAAAGLSPAIVKQARRALSFPHGWHVRVHVDGIVEVSQGVPTVLEVERAIGADTLDVVRLLDPDTHEALGLSMYLDDAGHRKELACNTIATALYLMRCRPGTDHFIAGDVLIVHDDDVTS